MKEEPSPPPRRAVEVGRRSPRGYSSRDAAPKGKGDLAARAEQKEGEGTRQGSPLGRRKPTKDEPPSREPRHRSRSRKRAGEGRARRESAHDSAHPPEGPAEPAPRKDGPSKAGSTAPSSRERRAARGDSPPHSAEPTGKARAQEEQGARAEEGRKGTKDGRDRPRREPRTRTRSRSREREGHHDRRSQRQVAHRPKDESPARRGSGRSGRSLSQQERLALAKYDPAESPENFAYLVKHIKAFQKKSERNRLAWKSIAIGNTLGRTTPSSAGLRSSAPS